MLKNYKSIAAAACLLGALTAPTVSFAGVQMSSGKEAKDLVEETKQSCISGDIGVNFVTAYYSRGIIQENQGVIAQPYLDLYLKLYEGTGFINKVTIGAQLWSSIHENRTAAAPGSELSEWYEFDYYVPLAVTFAKNFTLTTSYYEFDYPAANNIEPQRSVNFNLAYDDTDILGPFALHPHATVLYNFQGVAGLGQTSALYYEFGIAPGFCLLKDSMTPLTFSFPLTIGLGDDHFYPNEPYGFFSAGLTVAMPLKFVPECFGTWTITGGATYMNLGQATAAVNSHQDEHIVIGTAGIGMAF